MERAHDGGMFSLPSFSLPYTNTGSKKRNSRVIGLAYHLVFVSSAREKNRSIKLLTYAKGSLT